MCGERPKREPWVQFWCNCARVKSVKRVVKQATDRRMLVGGGVYAQRDGDAMCDRERCHGLMVAEGEAIHVWSSANCDSGV
jgi:tRNA-dihydrouridine synthase